MNTKSKHERLVFLEFAEATKLSFDANTVEVCCPPEPDIRCLCAGQPNYFELGRILDKHMQKSRIKAIKNAPQMVWADTKRIGLAERDVLRAKLTKKYSVGCNPLDLILYFDAENALLAGGLPPIEFATHAKHVMQPLLTPMPDHIRRVWVFERYRKSVLWNYPPLESKAMSGSRGKSL